MPTITERKPNMGILKFNHTLRSYLQNFYLIDYMKF